MFDDSAINTFFYGLYMDASVLKEHGIALQSCSVARLPHYKLEVGLRANVVPDERATVYGIVAELTGQQLSALYETSAIGGTYQPIAVLAEYEKGGWCPCLCYVRNTPSAEPISPEYARKLLAAISGYSFPVWYVQLIQDLLVEKA